MNTYEEYKKRKIEELKAQFKSDREERIEELNEKKTYECECGKTFNWKMKTFRQSKHNHHKSKTHIKLVEEKTKKYEKDVKNAFSVLSNPLLNIKMPPSRE